MPTPDTTALFTFGGAVLTDVQYHSLINIFLLTGALLFLGAIYARTLRGRLGFGLDRYAVTVGALVQFVAAVSYLALITRLLVGYEAHATAKGIMYVATNAPILNLPARYIDWAITVPLLIVEMIAISALGAEIGRRLRVVGVVAGFLMIFCGYLGSTSYLFPTALGARIGWGLISSVFFVVVYGIIIYAARHSLPGLTGDMGRSYKIATWVLLATWFVYPVVYFLTGYTTGGGWALILQGSLAVADLISKVGFALLVQRVALQRHRGVAAISTAGD
jgi:bacteriorhodopsin